MADFQEELLIGYARPSLIRNWRAMVRTKTCACTVFLTAVLISLITTWVILSSEIPNRDLVPTTTPRHSPIPTVMPLKFGSTTQPSRTTAMSSSTTKTTTTEPPTTSTTTTTTETPTTTTTTTEPPTTSTTTTTTTTTEPPTTTQTPTTTSTEPPMSTTAEPKTTPKSTFTFNINVVNFFDNFNKYLTSKQQDLIEMPLPPNATRISPLDLLTQMGMTPRFTETRCIFTMPRTYKFTVEVKGKQKFIGLAKKRRLAILAAAMAANENLFHIHYENPIPLPRLPCIHN